MSVTRVRGVHAQAAWKNWVDADLQPDQIQTETFAQTPTEDIEVDAQTLLLIVDSAGPATVNLPSGASIGRQITVASIGAGTVTVDAPVGESFVAGADVSLATGDSQTYIKISATLWLNAWGNN